MCPNSIDNHMISTAIWNKFFRITKLHEPVGRVQFGVFEKFTSFYLFQIAREQSCDYLFIIFIQRFRLRSTVTQSMHKTRVGRSSLRTKFTPFPLFYAQIRYTKLLYSVSRNNLIPVVDSQRIDITEFKKKCARFLKLFVPP